MDFSELSLRIWTPDQIQAAMSVLTFLVVAAAGIVGWRQLSEAKKARKEQQRPFVIVDASGPAQTSSGWKSRTSGGRSPAT